MADELAERVESQRRNLRPPAGSSDRVQVVVAPYRVCPIGAHSDHQLGPVLGIAISACTLLAFAPSADGSVRITSDGFPEEVAFDLRDPAAAHAGGWGSYAVAAARTIADRLPRDARGIFAHASGTLPGGGLSSSASVLLAYLSAFAAVNEVSLDSTALVSLSRRAENEFVGVASGILDPASIVASRRGQLLAIDTGRQRWECVAPGAAAPDHRILVAFTGTSRSLTATPFNQRVDECHAAAERLGTLAGRGGIRHLGDLSDAVFEEHLEELAPNLQNRARHFVGERARVTAGVEAWRRGDLDAFGVLMAESCRSSIENYETGSSEQIALQEILLATPGVFGARFSGAGFGGCSVALVDARRAEACREIVEARFAEAVPALADRARVFLVESVDGLRLA